MALNLFGTKGGFLVEDNFFHGWWGQGGMVSGEFRCFTFTVHFIPFIIASGPPQIIRHSIWEVGDPCPRAPAIGGGLQGLLFGGRVAGESGGQQPRGE